jgi:Spy/CpxP family protein refolding chaperone
MKLANRIHILFIFTAVSAWAQTEAARDRPAAPISKGKAPAMASLNTDGTSVIEQNFFTPEQIIQHQNAIGLSSDQQTAIREEIKKMIAQFTDLQWQESAETEALENLVKQARPDEKLVLAQLDKVLNVEDAIKRLRTGLLVRIKNILTPEQQGQLRGVKKNQEPQPKVAQ